MDAASSPPHRLTVERVVDPLDVDDARPVFSWQLPARPGAVQNSHRIRVVACPTGDDPDPRTATEGVVWDSGNVPTAASIDVEYGGSALTARTRYAWAVAVSLVGDPSTPVWSGTATFETGLLASAGLGRWITAPGEGAAGVDLDRADPERDVHRIWLPSTQPPQPGEAEFRTAFELPGGRPVLWARLVTGSAVAASVRLNGAAAADGGDAAALLRPGHNELLVHARAADEGHGGLLLRLDIGLAAHETVTVSTEDTWQVRSPADAGWVLAENIGRHGVSPHGRDRRSHRPSPYLRRDVTLTAPIARARLRATAIGVYEVRVNGQRLGPDRLAPGWVDLSFRLPYQVYDVTSLLRPGQNTVGAVLGDGWSLGNLCWFGTQHYARRRAFRAELDVLHTDGSRTIIDTDGSWSAADGAIRYADLQNGETIDARAARQGWDRPGWDPAGWVAAEPVSLSHGPLEAQVAPGIRVQRELPPASVVQRPDGRVLVDFGQNLVGWVRLALRAPVGHRVLLRHAEVLDADGELYVEGLRSARCTNEFIAAGADGCEMFEPSFTVHGFRYCEIVGYPGTLDPADIRARVAFAAMDPIGEFSCSDGRLNQLQSNIVWSQRGNFLTVPTDCPQRDERLGWTGDAQVFAATAAFNYDVRGFMRKWLRDVRDATGDDGGVPHVAPDVLSPQRKTPQVGAAGWGDVIAVLPHALLTAYGDTRCVAECLDAVAAWIGYLRRHSDQLIRPDEGFGDWLALEPTPTDLVSTAFFARTAHLAAELAVAVGDPRAVQWSALHDEVRTAFRRSYVRGGGRLVSGTQTGYVLALHFGLLDDHERPRAVERLIAAIRDRNWHLATGFLGTPYLLDVLTDGGHLDAAYRLLTTDSYPSWLYPIVHGGATTMWERWDSWSESRGFQDPAMTSFNHYAYGAVGDWMYRTIGGLTPLAPGFRRSRIAPRPGGGITHADTSLRTPYGLLRCAWRLDDQALRIEADVPPNTTAEVVAPDGVTFHGARVVTVGSGHHSFSGPITTG